MDCDVEVTNERPPEFQQRHPHPGGRRCKSARLRSTEKQRERSSPGRPRVCSHSRRSALTTRLLLPCRWPILARTSAGLRPVVYTPDAQPPQRHKSTTAHRAALSSAAARERRRRIVAAAATKTTAHPRPFPEQGRQQQQSPAAAAGVSRSAVKTGTLRGKPPRGVAPPPPRG